jgi:hypothetical protein
MCSSARTRARVGALSLGHGLPRGIAAPEAACATLPALRVLEGRAACLLDGRIRVSTDACRAFLDTRNVTEAVDRALPE